MAHVLAGDSVVINTDSLGVQFQWSEKSNADSFSKNQNLARCKCQYATSIYNPGWCREGCADLTLPVSAKAEAEGDAIVVVGIDRLGRNAAEVMTTIRDLGERGIVLRSLRKGIDTSNATGRMVAGVLASLAELELELGPERRTAARDARRARGQAIGRPKALDQSKVALAQRMHASGESATTIAATLGVSRATIYRILADADSAD